VLGCAVSFFITITLYRMHVRKLNRLLDGSEEDQQKAMKSGVTQQQVNLGWRYIGF
jgi:divalent metal cation (Fe/Co/Zn/Cd) transporter